jgi:ubiquitin-conjugating enzyme E2 O
VLIAVHSRLYSEKAYVLSRNFVRRALELPPGGLESEIHWLYRERGRLNKVLRDARALVEKSRVSQAQAIASDREEPPIPSDDADLAVPRLSEGGIITLERSLNKLQVIADTPTEPPQRGT